MLDTSNLSKFLKGITDAIRAKKGTTEPIEHKLIDEEIASIESGNPYQILQDRFLHSNRNNYSYLFAFSKITYDDFINLDIDTINNTNYNFSYMFYSCYNLSKTPPIDTRKGKNFFYMFGYCPNLKTISQLDLSNASSVNYIFDGSYALENISFVAECIKISIAFSDNHKLTDESIQSIIDGLAVVTTRKTITFHNTVKSKLTEEQIAIINEKGWTLA